MKCGLVVLLLVSVSCAVQVEDLVQPSWARTTRRGFCGTNKALDGHGDVWSEGGCETPVALVRQRHADESSAQRLRAAFELLETGVQCLSSSSDAGDGDNDPVTVTYRALDGKSTKSWTKCETDGGEPFLTVEAAFDAL